LKAGVRFVRVFGFVRTDIDWACSPFDATTPGVGLGTSQDEQGEDHQASQCADDGSGPKTRRLKGEFDIVFAGWNRDMQPSVFAFG